ncbi:MAG: hypothetical protein JOZ55_10180 [Alphaproteobacteria bacterium]|nr:hypothetical protein [Alphaproteobacteria bacterium]
MERSGFLSGFRLSSALPVLLALTGTVIANLPISFTGDRLPAPLLALMPIYYFTLVRPDLITPFWAFAIGFLEDVMAPGPPGVWAASFVVTYMVLVRQRESFAGLSGFPAVLGFANSVLIACASAWLIVSLLDWRILPVMPLVGELVTTVVLYIPIAAVLGGMQRRMVGPSRSEL